MKSAKGKDDEEMVFVEKIMKRFRGSGGFNLDALTQNDVEMEAFNNATLLQKVFIPIS